LSASVHDGLRANHQFNRPEKYIGPGDYFSTTDDILISTILGSCISVALYDVRHSVGGLNHFMLPFPKRAELDPYSPNSKYGVNAMELLINDILKKGGEKPALRAKVFGGSTVIDLDREATINVPKMNIDFVFNFLEMERIPVDAYSVGGALPRKILFFPLEQRVLMKFSRSSLVGLERREAQYAHKLLEDTENAGKPILF
jgi:chemotaxis protein CheD